MVFGITGNSGSGKSTLVNGFKSDYNIYIIDADKIGHSVLLMDKCKEEVLSNFGNEILENGEISRKKLGEVVFSDKVKLNLLTKITHKYIISEIKALLFKNKEKYDIIFLDAALLIESRLYDLCDVNILIKASLESKKNRIMLRDSLSEVEAVKRLEKQTDEVYLGSFCDVVIENNDISESQRVFNQSVIEKVKNENH